MVNSKLRMADAEFALLAAPSASAREVTIHNLLFPIQTLCSPRAVYWVLPGPLHMGAMILEKPTILWFSLYFLLFSC